ncbi:sugar transferase [Polynucleobacter sp. Tro8-14-1]|uniref:sugar transferase n=1 Tax=Polynucleobacter sp. Tro8-14-1 TaxID=1758383 RepID=UPI001C0B1753|nr:sugar transferase [Polynucleobacter sp. Tro8-14-1]MBU3563621.1 sugar transferase [Polynucleobacter sp. Tro8-14-1]
MQRIFDIIFSGTALFILCPLLIPIAILLRLTGEGEIFFIQKRLGKDGEVFGLYKFATMLKNSPNMTTGTITVKEDSRILPAGKWLRKSKLNELPQLLNILFGDMSVIGPRPLTAQTFGSYPLNTQRIIKTVRPGLSGVGSIIFRDEEDILSGKNEAIDFYTTTIAPYKGLLEEWYVKHKNLKNYFGAIGITAWVVCVPSSSIAWKFFRDLPRPPEGLEKILNYPTE